MGHSQKNRRAAGLAVGVCALALVLGAVAFVSTGKSPQAGPPEAVAEAQVDTSKRVFISGTLVNLREAASPTATPVKQVPLATECAVEEKAASGWWRVRCGDVQGWAAAEFLSSEKPTVEAFLAAAEDLKRPLKQRFDAALRAVTLEPTHAAARERFWRLFVEQERASLEELLAKQDAPLPQLHATASCEGEETSVESCLMSVLENGARMAEWYRFDFAPQEQTPRRLFVSVMLEKPIPQIESPHFWVRAGTFGGDAQNLDVQVLAASRYVPSDAMRLALEPEKPSNEKLPLFSKQLEGVLSEEALQLLRPLVGEWTQLERHDGKLSIVEYCDSQVVTISLKVGESSAHVHIEGGQDEDDFEVMGVQGAKDGSVVLKRWTGETLKYTLPRADKRVSGWVYSAWESINGSFVHATNKKDFPVVAPTEEECKEFFDGPQ
ncbi:hypothetical protein JY651_18275 [Pyxidicoccus parkwayensis]|uniref:SH3b domain-containing protein n=1 Tax=Pyxidicoccus parkwayensis TaxID=2813578 RepID=A0ABX7P8H0_9BACT|nr:hypothetical protein [Pyxidicoccus parkwaysis]QSQ26750.1 hypothetical protein JY651_18275 [Pyxidicoccus parkwaysis]